MTPANGPSNVYLLKKEIKGFCTKMADLFDSADTHRSFTGKLRIKKYLGRH